MKLKRLMIALGLSTLLFATQAAAATSANTVRGFVYEWFGLFDRNAPTATFLARLAEDEVRIDFPEQHLASHAEFATWYDGILRTFEHAAHDIKSLSVKESSDGWQVVLDVEWRATKFDGTAVEGLFHQNWLLRADNADRLEIRSIVITPVAAPAPYQPVAP